MPQEACRAGQYRHRHTGAPATGEAPVWPLVGRLGCALWRQRNAAEDGAGAPYGAASLAPISPRANWRSRIHGRACDRGPGRASPSGRTGPDAPRPTGRPACRTSSPCRVPAARRGPRRDTPRSAGPVAGSSPRPHPDTPSTPPPDRRGRRTAGGCRRDGRKPRHSPRARSRPAWRRPAWTGRPNGFPVRGRCDRSRDPDTGFRRRRSAAVRPSPTRWHRPPGSPSRW